MSSTSPHRARRQSPSEHALQDPSAQDLYLSAPSDPEPEELYFQATAIRLSSAGTSPGHHSAEHGSSNDGKEAYGQIDQAAPAQAYLTTRTNNFDFTDPNTPSEPSFFLGPLDADLANGPNSWQDERPSYGAGEAAAPTHPAWASSMIADLSQCLAAGPVDPSPPSHPANLSAHGKTPSRPGSVSESQQTGSNISHDPGERQSGRRESNKEMVSASAAGRSPIITISVSRGDSPESDAFSHTRRANQSSTHLAPVGPNEMSSGSDDDDVDERRSVSSLSVARFPDGAWIRSPSTGQAGVDPQSRGTEYVPSPNEVKSQIVREEKNTGISMWSASVSAAASDSGGESPILPPRRDFTGGRLRARSTGDRPLQQEDYFNLKARTGGRTVPGPGVLVHESSDEDLSERGSNISADSGSLPVHFDEAIRHDRSNPENNSSLELTDRAGNFLLYPWQDAPRDQTPRAEAMQPSSSNAAMVAFEKCARDLETASLTATIDNNSIINVGASFDNLTLSDRPKKSETRASSLLKRRFSSILKRRASDLSIAQPSPPTGQGGSEGPQQKGGHSPRHRWSLSTKHGRSPSLTSALISMSGQMAAVGGSHSVRAASPNSETINFPRKGRDRSRSEAPQPATLGLIDLMTSYGGPPVASVAQSPRPKSDAGPTAGRTMLDPDARGAEYEDETDLKDDKGLIMEFPAVSSLPVPTFEGFKAQIMQLNPQLEPALIHRLANAQLRRYKNLLELQQKHSTAVSKHACGSGKFCSAHRDEESSLQSRKASADSNSGQTRFRVADFSHDRSQPYVLDEEVIAEAQFPPGVPLPPVSRLPAEFECPICFEVRKLQKPSDWSKHVYEDVQPFTCTFPTCSEPKSFKRKADWTRHENELHRQLEWWTCSYPECNHTCYRKDNFVQHLVREHKMPDPKVKKRKGSAASEAPSNSQQERQLERVQEMVNTCRHETEKTPRQEPCRFCGNVCNSWRKLTVHLGKHMEQLAMPALELAKQSGTVSSGIHVNPMGLVSGSSAGESHSSFNAPSGTSTRLPHPQDPTRNTSTPADCALDTPLVNFPTISGGELSTEPEPMTDSLHASDPFLEYGMPQLRPPVLHPFQVQTHSPRENSVTYPPPYNAVPRPRTSEAEAIMVRNSYSVGSEFPPQISLHPAEGAYPAYQPMPPNVPRSSSPGASGYPSQV